MKSLDLKNQKFGKLLVLSINRIENNGSYNKTYWNCVCDCGNEKITDTGLLRSGRCKSCGCLLKIASNKEEDRNKAVIKNLFNSSIRKRSKKIGLEYNISIEYFTELINKSCHYCGIEHSNSLKDRLWSSRKGGKKYNYVVSDYVLVFNGIDRIDSDKGYITGNVVPCCKYCNSAKNIMSDFEFKNFISRIYNHYINPNNIKLTN